MDNTPIPTRTIGPVLIHGHCIDGEIKVPMATYETTLWPSTSRGAKISRLCGGICTLVLSDSMTRSVALQAADANTASQRAKAIQSQLAKMQSIVAKTSHFCQLEEVEIDQIGAIVYLRFRFTTGDAAGHNMTTKASDALLQWLLLHYADLNYITISANLCTDKKVSAINAVQGRGKHVIAELTIPKTICEKHLRTTPEKLVELNIKKNLLGGVLAGSLRTANAHYANMLLATYLATGQDAANIVEGSQGITHCEVQENGDLYFSVNLPNIIVGTVGNGKDNETVQQHLNELGCLAKRDTGDNSKRLAEIIAATVLCGELSLMAAQTNLGELTKSHMLFER